MGTQGFAKNSKCLFLSHHPCKSKSLFGSTESTRDCSAHLKRKDYQINSTLPQTQKKVHALKPFSWKREKWLKICNLFILKRRGRWGGKGRGVGGGRKKLNDKPML